jgi:hypothetical protein
MKIFLSVLYAVFLFAMGCGIYIAYRDAEGLVEDDYYEHARSYFQTKASENTLGLAVSMPETLRKGNNDIRIVMKTHDKPLEHAVTRLFIGNLTKRGYDSTRLMKEISPGIYQANAVIPFKGIWLIRMELEKDHLKTSRKWFVELD